MLILATYSCNEFHSMKNIVLAELALGWKWVLTGWFVTIRMRAQIQPASK